MTSEDESVGSSPSVINQNLFPARGFKAPHSGVAPFGGPCFYCKEKGHVAKYCPRRLDISSEAKAPATNFRNPHIQCRCGAGTCVIRTSSTQRNPNRQFFSCPAKFEQKCGYFRWCDEVKKDELVLPPMEFPTCACGAGICSTFTAETGSFAGQKFFVCPVKKGQGACNFMKRMDETVIDDGSEVGFTGTQYGVTTASSSSSSMSACTKEKGDESQETKFNNYCSGDDGEENDSCLLKSKCSQYGELARHRTTFLSLLPKAEKKQQQQFDLYKGLLDWCDREKAQLDGLARIHAETSIAVSTFKASLQLVHEKEKTFGLRIGFYKHLASCEAKVACVVGYLNQMSQDRLEANRILQALSKDAQEALKIGERLGSPW